jgi:hypothetical protein
VHLDQHCIYINGSVPTQTCIVIRIAMITTITIMTIRVMIMTVIPIKICPKETQQAGVESRFLGSTMEGLTKVSALLVAPPVTFLAAY